MPKKLSVLRILRNRFVAGLIILVPIVVTVQSLWWLFIFIEDYSRPLASAFTEHKIPGVGILSTVLVVLLTGLLFSSGPLKRLLDSFEEVLEYIPLVGVVYGTIKKVFSGFGNLRGGDAFKRFVLARLPGRTTPGFLTGSFELQGADGSVQPMCMVYIPTNHLWFGDVVVLPVHDVIETDISIEDGISLILSAGAAVPRRVGRVNGIER